MSLGNSLTQTWIHNRQELREQPKPAKGGITMCFLKLNFREHFQTLGIIASSEHRITLIIGLFQTSDTVFLPRPGGTDIIQSATLHF